MSTTEKRKISNSPKAQLKSTSSLEERLSQILPKNWDFDQEDLCVEFYKAFERGENYQKRNAEEKLKDKINQLFERAAYLSETLFLKIKNEMDIDAQRMMLNISNLPTFQTIIIVPKSVFLSPKMKFIYKEAFDLKSKFNDSNFRIDFHFMKASDNINHSLLEADGYILTYSDETRTKKELS